MTATNMCSNFVVLGIVPQGRKRDRGRKERETEEGKKERQRK